jgi:PKD repeat protein
MVGRLDMNITPGLKAATILMILLLVCSSAPSFCGGDRSSEGTHGPALADASGQRAIERPDHDGPYAVGYMYETIWPSTKGYSTTIKFFYPARTAGLNATADPGGAPFATVVQLTGFGGGVESLNGVATRMSSWGLVIAEFGVNWNDWPNCANESDMKDLLDQLERDNATLSHRMYGMIDKEAFGIHGYSSGGGLCLWDASFEHRFKAVDSWASAIDNGVIDAIAPNFWQPVQLQAGQNDAGYRPNAAHAYQVFGPPKAFLEITGGTHQGPYIYDAMISFFLRYLKGISGYDLYLYGAGAMDDAANLNYSLKFTLANGSFFPPSITIRGSNSTINEDGQVDFACVYDGFLPLGHPRGSFSWDLDSDAVVEAGGASNITASCTYPKSGVFSASMWYDLGGLRIPANRTLPVVVLNLPPTVRSQNDRYSDEDEPVQFTAEASDTPSDIAGLSFSWDFGDGSTCSTQNASHVYRKAGTYPVKLSVQDDNGAEARDGFNITVSNLPPSVSAGTVPAVWKDAEVAFTGQGNDTPSDTGRLQYSWDFGDGARSDWSSFPDSVHTYLRSGNFSANLSARDDDGALAFASSHVTVLNAPPTAGIRLPQDRSVFDKDEELDFFGGGTDTPSDRQSLLFSWDFGDGNLTDWAPDAGATHTYTRGGRYVAAILVRDAEGALAQTTVNITVENAPPAVRVLAPAGAAFAEDEDVRFSAEGDDTESDLGILNYIWEIDGESHPGATFEMSFSSEGPHSFKVTVTDPEGATGTAAGTVNIKNPAPRLTADVSPVRIFEQDTINFSATVTDTGSDISGLNVSWDLGDGVTVHGISGSHAYARKGTYNVLVTVTDDEDASAEQSFTVSVDARPATPPPETTRPASPNNSLYIVLGAVCAAAAVCAIFAVKRGRKRMTGQPGDR